MNRSGVAPKHLEIEQSHHYASPERVRYAHSTDSTLGEKGVLWGGCTTREASARFAPGSDFLSHHLTAIPWIPLRPRQQGLHIIDADVKSSRREKNENENHMLADEIAEGCLESLGVQGGMERSLGNCIQSSERQ